MDEIYAVAVVDARYSSLMRVLGNETARHTDVECDRIGTMTAYWISTYQEILDPAKMAAYAELAAPALIEGGGRFLARGFPEQTYEAGGDGRTVLIQFASVEAARTAHDSPAYQRALAALDGGAVRDIRIVPAAD